MLVSSVLHLNSQRAKAVSNFVPCLAQLKMQIEHNFYDAYANAPGSCSLWEPAWKIPQCY